MRKLFILFMLIGINSIAQRVRTTPTFDSDIWTRPRPGLYGIGVRDNQPYLIGNTNDPIRIKTEYAYIVGVQLNNSGEIEYPGGAYQGRRTEVVSLNKDSLTVTLPNPKSSVNQERELTFVCHFFSGSLFKYFDTNYCVRFTDTIFVNQNDQTYTFLPNTCIGSMTTEPSSIAKGIKPGHSFRLSEMDRRWYLHFNKINY
jgi:hypothetical protein